MGGLDFFYSVSIANGCSQRGTVSFRRVCFHLTSLPVVQLVLPFSNSENMSVHNNFQIVNTYNYHVHTTMCSIVYKMSQDPEKGEVR